MHEVKLKGKTGGYTHWRMKEGPGSAETIQNEKGLWVPIWGSEGGNENWRRMTKLTSDAKCDLVAALTVGILETAVQAIATHVHLYEDKLWPFLPPIGLHICPIHLPRDWGIFIQRATLHCHIAADPCILVPASWVREQNIISNMSCIRQMSAGQTYQARQNTSPFAALVF